MRDMSQKGEKAVLQVHGDIGGKILPKESSVQLRSFGDAPEFDLAVRGVTHRSTGQGKSTASMEVKPQ